MKCLRFVWTTVSDCRKQTGPPDAGNNLRKSHFIVCYVTKYSTILGVFHHPWPGISPTAILNEEKALVTRLVDQIPPLFISTLKRFSFIALHNGSALPCCNPVGYCNEIAEDIGVHFSLFRTLYIPSEHKKETSFRNWVNEKIAKLIPFNVILFRVALIFRVRSAQKLALSDGVLLKRLCLLVFLYCGYLTAWTILRPPTVETARTSDDLKYERCIENWFDLTITFGKREAHAVAVCQHICRGTSTTTFREGGEEKVPKLLGCIYLWHCLLHVPISL